MTHEFKHHHAQVGAIKIHYVREGNGTPVLLLHGWPGFWFDWHLNIPELAQRFDVVAPDLRGFGYSDKPDLPPEQGYTDEAHAGDVMGLIEALKLGVVDVVAYDIGAIVAQSFALKYPNALRKLILFDPPYPGVGMRWFDITHLQETWYQSFHQLQLAEDLVGSSRRATELYLRHFLSHWSYNPNLFADDEIAQYVEAFSQPGALRGGFNNYRAFRRAPTAALTPGWTIAHPTLVLWGDSDSIIPVAWSDNLKDYFKNLIFKKLEHCGHFCQREAPEAVNREVLQFLG
jgi:pimeloyl-ACP methyl ester carboxylesterase